MGGGGTNCTGTAELFNQILFFKTFLKGRSLLRKKKNKVTLRTTTKQWNMDTSRESANRNVCLGDITDGQLDNISKAQLLLGMMCLLIHMEMF